MADEIDRHKIVKDVFNDNYFSLSTTIKIPCSSGAESTVLSAVS